MRKDDGDVRRGCRQIASAAELGFGEWAPLAIRRAPRHDCRERSASQPPAIERSDSSVMSAYGGVHAFSCFAGQRILDSCQYLECNISTTFEENQSFI
jgi:hypothetical protein